MQIIGQRFPLEATIDRKVQFLIIVLVLFLLGRLIIKGFYNAFLHPLASIPGPALAKVFANYMTPAKIALRKAYKLKELHDQYGPIVRVGPNEVSIGEWSAYREIFNGRTSSKPEEFYSRATIGGRHNAISSITNKEKHAARRKMENPFFSQQAILANAALIAERADILVERIISSAKKTASGKTSDVYELNALYTLEVILKTTFNRSYGKSPNGESLKLLRAMESSHKARGAMFAIPWLSRKRGVHLPGQLGHFFRQFEIWQSMTQELIERFKKEELDSDSGEMKFVLTGILLSQDSYLGRRLTDDEVHEEIMSMLFGGSGTTSVTLTYLIYSVARDPGIQEKLRQELCASGESLAELQQLPYLSAVIKETMRLYPTIISTLPRILEMPMTIGKQVLPSGTLVGMQNYVHQRDSAVFSKADSFIPERWLGYKAKVMNAALTPFSLGPMNCLGQNLARAELYVAASKLFRKLRLSLNSEMMESEMVMEDRFAMNPKGRRLLVDIEFVN